MNRNMLLFVLLGGLGSCAAMSAVGRRPVQNLCTFSAVDDYLSAHIEIDAYHVEALKNNSADIDLSLLVQHPELAVNTIIMDRSVGVLLGTDEEKSFLGNAKNAQYFPNLVEFGFGWDCDKMPPFVLALPDVKILRLVQCFGANVLPRQFPKGLEALHFNCFHFKEMRWAQRSKFLACSSQMFLPGLKQLIFTYCSGLEGFLDVLPASLEFIDWHTCYPVLGGEIPPCVRALPYLKELHISMPRPQKLRKKISDTQKNEEVVAEAPVVYPDFYNASGGLVKVTRTVFAEKMPIPV